MPTIQDDVISLINDICRPEKPDLGDGSRSLLECGLDSLDFATVMMAIEDKFHVTISEDDLQRLRSLNSIVAFLAESRPA